MTSDELPAWMDHDDRTPRPMCARCLKPKTVCYCASLVSLETRSRVVILQHPRETNVAIGTARMAHLCLPRSSLHIGMEWDGTKELADACADPERPAVLLYPGPDARDILADPPVGPVTLIVVDGTWSQARKVVRENPELAALPRFAFSAPEPTRYRIRNEPAPEFVSTLEALMHALGALEGDRERFRQLMRPMNAMIDMQIVAKGVHRRPRHPRPRPRLTFSQRLPRKLLERHDDLVLVFADANAWPYGTPQHALGDELICWLAHRPATGETFQRVVAPRNPLAPEVPAHTGIAAETLLAGCKVTELLEDFAAFTRPTDVMTSWGHHGLRLFKDCGGALRDGFVDLRQAARVLTNRKNGPLERYAESLEIGEPEGFPPGRAGRRLGLVAGIVRAWRERAAE